jgi:hypothetical protein
LGTHTFFFPVEGRGEVDQLDTFANVDERRVYVVTLDRLDGAIGPRLKIRPDVDECVRLDDALGDTRIGFPPVAVQSGRDEIFHCQWRSIRDFSAEVEETEEGGHCDRTITASLAFTSGQSRRIRQSSAASESR